MPLQSAFEGIPAAGQTEPDDRTTEQIIDAALAEFSAFGFRRVNVGELPSERVCIARLYIDAFRRRMH